MRDYISFRIKLTAVVFAATLLSFVLFLAVENYLWIRKVSSLFHSFFGFSFYAGRALIGVSLSILTALTVYIFSESFYNALRKFSHRIQHWSGSLSVIAPKELHYEGADEIGEMMLYMDNAILRHESATKEKIRKSIERNNLSIAQRLEPYTPAITIHGLDIMEISYFPKEILAPYCDYTDIIETPSGYICIMAGFEQYSILGSIFKHRLNSIIYMSKLNLPLPEEEIISRICSAVSTHPPENVSFSLFLVNGASNLVTYLHTAKTPALLISDRGITLIPANYHDYPKSTPEFTKTPLPAYAYLLLLSDRIHEYLDISVDQLLVELKERVLNKPGYASSRDLIKETSLLLESLAIAKDLNGILDIASLFVLRKIR